MKVWVKTLPVQGDDGWYRTGYDVVDAAGNSLRPGEQYFEFAIEAMDWIAERYGLAGVTIHSLGA